MRILISTEYFTQKVGGAEKVLHRLVDAMLTRGDQVTVVSFQREEVFSWHGDGNLRVLNFKPFSPLEISVEALTKIKMGTKFDVVFSQHYYHFSSFYAALIAKRHRLPFVLKPIGIYGNLGFIRNLGFALLDATQGRYVLNHATLILPTTNYEANVLMDLGIPGEKMRIIPSGVDDLPTIEIGQIDQMKKELGISEGDKVILYVGRIEMEKGTDILVRAMPLVRQRFANSKFLVVGPAPDLRGKNILPERDYIIVAGELYGNELAAAYYLSDVFVCPSRLELSPLSVKEASLAQLPVIASSVGGLPEIITDYFNGFLFEPGDYQELAHWIIEALEHPDQMGARGRQLTLGAFSMKNYLERTLEAIDNVAKAK